MQVRSIWNFHSRQGTLKRGIREQQSRGKIAVGDQPAFAINVFEQEIEQLRALDNGIEIAVVRVLHDSVGVDVPGDAERVEQLLKQELRNSGS